MIDPVSLDPIALLRQASLPVRATAGLLGLASLSVWFVGVLKLLQLMRMASRQALFERHAQRADCCSDLDRIASMIGDAPGARIVRAMASRGTTTKDRLRAVADRAVVDERRRAGALIGVLGSSAAVAPFVGLFGTVYGIMDAFVRIGAEKSASLPVVAPAIGEALLTTAIGLAAAIPAVLFYNAIDRRIGDLVATLESSAAEWVEIALKPGLAPAPETRAARPVPRGPEVLGGVAPVSKRGVA
jgi:biopolymer transport protein TolQ